MLYLLRSPSWVASNQTHPLPVTLPAALIVVLVAHPTWLTREQLALIFWPEATPSDALRLLRVTMHRTRAILEGWGVAESLHAERTRIRLTLACDLITLREAQKRNDTEVLQSLTPSLWLQGWRLPGYDDFAQWCETTAKSLQEDWLAAFRRSLQSPRPRAQASPNGRDREWQALLDSQAPAVLLWGEPGAGKTTLVRAAWPNAPCLRGLEGLQSMPYRPLLDALRERRSTLEMALGDPDHPLRPYRPDLLRVMPELAPDEELPPLEGLIARSRLVEALTRAFEAVSPVIVVDDLQWFEVQSIEWLLMLAQSRRLRWRATARSEEANSRLHRRLQPLRNASLLDEITLGEIDGECLARICQSSFPEQIFSPSRFANLLATSGGNPLLVVELVRAGLDGQPAAGPAKVHERITQIMQGRLQRLPLWVRHVVEAAAIFVEPVPPEALSQPTTLGPRARNARKAAGATACNRAIAAGLLQAVHDRIVCRHDLVRHAVQLGISPPRRKLLHRQAAQWLVTQGGDALTIAEHWRAAEEVETALTWRHLGAGQLKARGRFDEACSIWQEVADTSRDAGLALHARMELAACDLFSNLARGESALIAVQAQLAGIEDPAQRLQLEGRVKTALVDNRVFAGDIEAARGHAVRLREVLSDLSDGDQGSAAEVLIELAMREPDIPGAWALLARMRRLSPQRPALLSFEGQIHWFGGQVQAAHDALARLLERHPDYCRGLTIENDLAVMLQALGRINEADEMARRSLQSWAGVPHTETLSLLALGLTLTSAGSHAEADRALQRARDLAMSQFSPGLEAEARVRRARLLLHCGDNAAAQRELDIAAPLLQHCPEPLRVSQLVLVEVEAAAAAGRPLPIAEMLRLEDLAMRSDHPLVRARLAWVQGLAAIVRGDALGALLAARHQEAVARAAGLQEVLAEALWLQARAIHLTGAPEVTLKPLVDSALELAKRQGCAGVAARATYWFSQMQPLANVSSGLAVHEPSGNLPLLRRVPDAPRRG